MKICTTCHKTKSLLDFNVKKSSSDGRATRCRVCAKSAQAIYRAENSDKLKESQAEYRKNNSEKLKARKALDRKKRAEHIKKKLSDWYCINKERVSIYAKKRYIENAESIKQKTENYRLANSEKIKLNQAAYRQKNKEKAKKYHAEWRVKNQEISKQHRRNRRARLKSAIGKLSRDIGKKLFNLQKGKCACCKKPLGNDYHMDHIMPLALGGTNTDDNIQLLRSKCNLQKNAKHPVEFMQSLGYLL